MSYVPGVEPCSARDLFRAWRFPQLFCVLGRSGDISGDGFRVAPRFASASLPPSLASAFTRKEDRDKPNGQEVKEAQYDAIVEWGIPDESKLNRLVGIRQPTLVTNGDNDTMIPDDQQPHPRRAPAERAGADLPRRRPRLPLLVAGRVRQRRQDVPRGVTHALAAQLVAAASSSISGRYSPLRAAPLSAARWRKATCAARRFAASPPHARRTGACRARP
jgi:hypothetical protein